jgi:hypothetical protein
MVKKRARRQQPARLLANQRSNIPAYVIAFIGAASAMIQGGTWAALTVFIAALVVAGAIEVLKR